MRKPSAVAKQDLTRYRVLGSLLESAEDENDTGRVIEIKVERLVIKERLRRQGHYV